MTTAHVPRAEGRCLIGPRWAELAIIFIIFLSPFQVGAQDRVVTLLAAESSAQLRVADPSRDANPPEPAQSAFLYFKVPPYVIPLDANIKKVELQLVSDGRQVPKTAMYFHIRPVAWDARNRKPDASRSFEVVGNVASSAHAVIDIGVLKPNRNDLFRSLDGEQYIALELVSTATAGGLGSGSARHYANRMASDASRAPRLIVTYSMPSDSKPPEWASPSAPGQLGTVNFMTQPAQQSLRIVRLLADRADKSYTGTPVSFGNLLWLIPDGKRLVASKPSGGYVGSGVRLADVEEGAQMVVNASGRLTILTSTSITALQLDADFPDRSVRLDQLQKVHYPDLTLKPGSVVAGEDGAIYAATGTKIIALNPELMLLWKGDISALDSGVKMAMSPTGRFLYVADKTGLKAFNAQTGAVWQLNWQPAAEFVHTPVVTRRVTANTAEDWIFVAANSAGSGALRAVINSPSEAKPGEARLLPIGTAKGQAGWEMRGEFFSRPLLDGETDGKSSEKRLYVVTADANKKLRMRVLRVSNGEVVQTSESGTSTQASNLWQEGGPVMDIARNVFFWDNGTLHGMNAKAEKLFAMTPGTLGKNATLLFGPDGALLASDGPGKTEAHVIVPNVQIAGSSPSEICGMTNLWITGAPAGNLAIRAKTQVLLNGLSIGPGHSFGIYKAESCQ